MYWLFMCRGSYYTDKMAFALCWWQLEQLEHLHSENTLRHPMITLIIDSYWIPSQNKTKPTLHIWRICQNFKFMNFKYWGRYRADTILSTDGQMDRLMEGQTDRWTRWNHYTPLQLCWAGGIIKHFWRVWLNKLHETTYSIDCIIKTKQYIKKTIGIIRTLIKLHLYPLVPILKMKPWNSW